MNPWESECFIVAVSYGHCGDIQFAWVGITSSRKASYQAAKAGVSRSRLRREPVIIFHLPHIVCCQVLISLPQWHPIYSFTWSHFTAGCSTSSSYFHSLCIPCKIKVPSHVLPTLILNTCIRQKVVYTLIYT